MNYLQIGSFVILAFVPQSLPADQIFLKTSKVVGTVVEMSKTDITIEQGCTTKELKVIPVNQISMIDFSDNNCEFELSASTSSYGVGLNSGSRACVGGFLVKFAGKSKALQLTTTELSIDNAIGTFYPNEKTTIAGATEELESIEILDCETFKLLHNSQSARWPASYREIEEIEDASKID